MKPLLLCLLALSLITPRFTAYAQMDTPDSAEVGASLPVDQPGAEQGAAIDTAKAADRIVVDTVITIPRLEFTGVTLFDAITALARAYNLSIYMDSSVVGVIHLRLDNVTLNDALTFIFDQYELDWQKTGDIIRVSKQAPPPPKLMPLDLTYENDLLSVNVRDAELQRFVDDLIDLTGMNIVIEGGARGRVSAKLANLELEKALRVIFPTNGYVYRMVDGIAYIGPGQTSQQGTAMARNLSASCKDGLVSLDVANQSLADVVALIASQCGISIFIQTKIEGDIRASFQDKTIEETLTYILLNSPYTFKESNGIYFVGSRDSEDLYDTKLVKLNHLIATTVEAVIPVSLSKQLTIKTVKEHNGLVLTGPRTSIAKLEAFINEIDVPMAQVLFEVLVVDYNTTDRAEFGITANNFGGDSGLPGEIYYPEIDISDVGVNLNKDLRSLESHLGISNLGTLDSDFFIRLQMMQQQGTANIQSHPKIAALNGHSASIAIGTSQYYLLESQTVYPSQQSDVSTQTSQRFEIVEADMKLEVVPFVNSNRELIVEVKPEFNTPAESFNPDIPPTINRRVLNSTVRLKDGETIVLGGLVQSSKSQTIDKLPILGSIPIIGRLFQNRKSTEIKSELMIYITPHVYYGSEGSVNIDSVLIKK